MGAAASSSSPSNAINREGIDSARRRKLASQRQRWIVDNNFKELGNYLPLYRAALKGEWREAKRIFDEDAAALTAKITVASETTLHIAVGTGRSRDFVETLVRIISPDELALTDQNGETALVVAATVGNIYAAKLLVNKNPDLPNIAAKSGFPIHRAAEYGHREMVLYLLRVTRKDSDPSPFVGEYGVKLLTSVIIAEFYDIALEMVEQHPDLAIMELNGVGSPLSVLAGKPNAFPSGCPLKFWKYFPRIFAYKKAIKEAELKHKYPLELVKCLCSEIMELDDAKAFSMFQPPLHLAAELGIHEIVEEIIAVFPPAIWSSDAQNRNVFQLAVMYRRETVFNLIYQMSDYRHLVTKYIDRDGNNILHLAGMSPPPDRLKLVSGAALQMQRELQWFEIVETFVQPAHKMSKNKNKETPAVMFSRTHEDLVKEGERWMKETATSCTVVSALIATVVFAAAITVPGGNDQNKGFPLYVQPELRQQSAFLIFGISDAISLFSSVASILMFLSILTSRYSEADFLRDLPRKLFIGLASLFISITSLMVAFGATLFLVFGQKQIWRLAPIVMMALVPVYLFMYSQYPLFIDILVAAYGSGIFRQQSSRTIH